MANYVCIYMRGWHTYSALPDEDSFNIIVLDTPNFLPSLFFLHIMISFIPLLAAISAYVVPTTYAFDLHRRADQSPTNFTLYAYGKNVTSGLQMFYGDGRLSEASFDRSIDVD